MKEKVKLIQGNPDRVDEIRKTLEEWGACRNLACYSFKDDFFYYYVNQFGSVCEIGEKYAKEVISESRAEIYELPQQKHQFKPFEKVLVRDYDYKEWRCDFFSHMLKDGEYSCIGRSWKKCIPYEGNEYLLGTNGKPNQ